MAAFISLARVSRRDESYGLGMWGRSFIHSFIYMTAIYCVPTLSQPSLLGHRGEPEPGPCFRDPDKDLPPLEVLPAATQGAWKQRKGDQYGQSRSLLEKWPQLESWGRGSQEKWRWSKGRGGALTFATAWGIFFLASFTSWPSCSPLQKKKNK